MDLAEFRTSLDRWIEQHAEELAAPRDPVGARWRNGSAPPGEAVPSAMDREMAQLAHVKRLAYDAGWMRWGWPERVGGLGGSPLLRAYLGEALTTQELVDPGLYSMTEVLAPTMIDFAPTELAAEMVPRLLRGDEMWCQGFSEPDAGSDLAALSCRARRDGDHWVVDGQKVWTSLAQYAQRCVLLTRTGAADSRHRGITALFVDMDTPGITVRPIEAMHGREDFSEVFFDAVAVPVERTLGREGDGWAVAMDLLPYERSTALWHRSAHLRRRFERLLEEAPPGALRPDAVGQVAQHLIALRARSRATQRRMGAGESLGAETSIDKILLSTAEQALYDLVLDGRRSEVLIGDSSSDQRWREEYLYSRASSIYGGSAEIQRNIVARRLLDLGPER